MYGYAKIPKQRVPLSQKSEQWRKDCVNAFINISKFGLSERRNTLKTLYDYYNGEIDEQDYKYVLKPYGKTRENFPSKLRNYPIIKPIIDLLLGEKSKRPMNYTVVVENADAITMKEEAKKQSLLTNIQATFIAKLQQQMDPNNPQQQQPELPKQIIEQFERTYVDDRAIKGQAAINYIMQKEEIYDKFQKQFFHFLVAGECYSHKGVRRKEPFYEVLNPLDIDFDKDPDIDFVEDGDWAIIRKFAHASTLVDQFGDYLTEEQVLELENPTHQSVDTYLLYRSEAAGNNDNIYRNRLIECITVYWKSRKRIGFVEYMDQTTGTIEEMEVDENYKLPAELKAQGAKIKFEWVNEVWEGTRIDGRFYIKMSPIPNQRTSMDNPSLCKLPINGRRYSDVNSNNISLVSLGIPYQLNYNIFKYRMELSIARSKDIIAQFDINLIPKKWDMDKFMYYVEGTGIAWVDYNQEGIQLSPTHQSVLDMSVKTIGQYIQLLDAIMVEWEKISGVNRQRQGTIGTYEGKGASQQAIVQSSHITEDIFRKFAQFEQRELQGLLDYSKEAWISGKKGTYILPDTSIQYLDLDSLGHMETEYGIFLSDSGKDQENLQQARSIAQAMMQNGVPASAVLELLDTENFASIKDKIARAERAQQELQKAQQQAEMEMKQQELASKQQESQMKYQDSERNRQKDIEIALINAEASDQTNRLDIDLQKIISDFEIRQKELDIKQQELGLKEQAQSTPQAKQK